MAITMIDPYNVSATDFNSSHLKAKLQKQLVPLLYRTYMNEFFDKTT